MQELVEKVQAKTTITSAALEEELHGRFSVQPLGAARTELAWQYARTACGRARLAAKADLSAK